MIKDERKLARITAKSNEPIRQVMRAVKEALDLQANLLHPSQAPGPVLPRWESAMPSRSLRSPKSTGSLAHTCTTR